MWGKGGGAAGGTGVIGGTGPVVFSMTCLSSTKNLTIVLDHHHQSITQYCLETEPCHAILPFYLDKACDFRNPKHLFPPFSHPKPGEGAPKQLMPIDSAQQPMSAGAAYNRGQQAM